MTTDKWSPSVELVLLPGEAFLEAASDDKPPICGGCKAVVQFEESYYSSDEDDRGILCESCLKPELEMLTAEAIEYAVERCRITREITPDHPSYDDRAYRVHLRDYCTNFGALIEPFDPESTLLDNRVYREVISQRIDDLLTPHYPPPPRCTRVSRADLIVLGGRQPSPPLT